MEINDEESFVLARRRLAGFVAMVAFLVLMASALGAMLYLTSTAAGQANADAKVRASQPLTMSQPNGLLTDGAESQDATAKTLLGSAKFLVRLAWLSAALLGLTLLALFGVVTHFILQRLAVNTPHERTQYVNAWSLAGQRVKPLEEDSPTDDEDSDDSDEKGDDKQS